MTLLSKLNNFLADRFNYYLTLTVSGLVLALLVLAILNLGSRPHVKSIYFEGGAAQLTTVLAPKLLIDFAQPMDRQSVEDVLLLSPAVEFDTSWSLNKLQIKFKYNLDSGTNYHLQIGDQAKDIFGTQIAPVVDFSFTTPELSFVYLERNSREYQPDRIIRYFIGANTEKVLYSADNIIGFTENDSYLVVAVRTESGSALRIVDLKQDSFVTLDWGGDNLLVGKVHMSPVADQIAFTAQVVEMVNGIAVPKTASYIYYYDIPTRKLTRLPPENVLDMQFAPDGASLLFRGEDALYYLIELANPDNYVQLGRHFSTGGFNRSREQIVFVDYDPINLGSPYPFLNVYDRNRQSITLTKGESFVVDPEFFHNSNHLVISEKFSDLESSRGLFGIVVINEDGTGQSMIKLPGYSLELPKISLDDQYLLIEKYSSENLTDFTGMRDYVFQTKPYQGTLVIYDLVQQKFLDVELRGVESEWQ